MELESASAKPKYQINPKSRKKRTLHHSHSPPLIKPSLLNIKINPRREKWSMITVEYPDSLMCAHCFFITRLRVFEFLWVRPAPPRKSEPKPNKNWVLSPTPKPNPDWWYRFSFFSCQKAALPKSRSSLSNVACGASNVSVPYGRPEKPWPKVKFLCSSSKTLACQDLNKTGTRQRASLYNYVLRAVDHPVIQFLCYTTSANAVCPLRAKRKSALKCRFLHPVIIDTWWRKKSTRVTFFSHERGESQTVHRPGGRRREIQLTYSAFQS